MIVYPNGKVRIHLFGRAHLSDGRAALKFKAPQRALSLLSYLLIHSDRALSRDAAAFALWPDRTETEARADLRRHLYYLMNDALPPAAQSTPWILSDKRTVQWNPDAPAWCDVLAFRECSANPGLAAQAVELYRGDLLEGFEDEWLLEHRDRIREKQIDLLLNLIAANRESRNYNEAIAYTKRLLAVDPWREDGIRALIALRHATGDRAGALSTYQDFAKRLEDELGVPPMAETTAEYRRVATADDPEIATTALAGKRPESIVGTDAVRSTPSFTGREEELRAIDSALWNEGKIAIVHGLGGIGKSVIAREYARRNRDRYSVIWALNAEDEAGIIEGLVRLGSQLVPDLEKAGDRRAAAAQVIANELGSFGKPALLIYDNVQDDRLLREWIAPGAHVIVTSRYSAWSGDAAAIWLDTLRVDETVNYLCREVGRTDIGDAQAEEIARRLECFPLAVAHAAAYLRATPNVTARRYLDRIGDHLAIAPRGADYQQAVLATFCEAIVKAEEDAPGAAALLVLAAFFAPGAIAEELFAQPAEAYGKLAPHLGTQTAALDLRACVCSAARTDDALGALHRFSLLVFSPETRTYRLHPLVQQAARAFAGSDAQPWIQSAVGAVEAAFPPVDFETWRLCERLLPHGRAALAALDAGSGFAPGARLANACGNYLAKRAAFLDSEKLLRFGLQIAERSKQERDPHVASNLNTLARLLRDTNRHAEAANLHRRAIEIYENELGSDHPVVEAVLNEIAELLNGESSAAAA